MAAEIGTRIVSKARELGATMAGFASVEALRASPSYVMLSRIGSVGNGSPPIPGLPDAEDVKWPASAKSVLVMAVAHPVDEPELDWRAPSSGSTKGNILLARLNEQLSAYIEGRLSIRTHPMPYSVGSGGIYLKDAAVLAGLGCIGKNNLLVTPELGPRIRFRGMLIEEELTPTGPIDFDPCANCEELCRKACPQHAFDAAVISSLDVGMATLPGRDGFFSKPTCYIQMEDDVRASGASPSNWPDTRGQEEPIKYCRRCELACPVGNQVEHDF